MSESVGPSQPPDPLGNQTDPSPTTLDVIVQLCIPQSLSINSVDGGLDSGL